MKRSDSTSKRNANPMHFSAMGDVSVCGKPVAMLAWSRDVGAWLKRPARERCPHCERAILDQRAANLREVEALERVNPPAVRAR